MHEAINCTKKVGSPRPIQMLDIDKGYNGVNGSFLWNALES